MILRTVLPLLTLTSASLASAQVSYLLDAASGHVPPFSLFSANGVDARTKVTPQGYLLEAKFNTGDWVSLRTRAVDHVAFAAMNSVELTLDLRGHSRFSPRFTMTDRANGKEEFWWVDFPDIAPGTYTLCANLDTAKISFGVGSLQNDHRLDRTAIHAVEVNFTRPSDMQVPQELTVFMTMIRLHPTKNCIEN
ncbi:hypothetical protein ACOTTU_12840 [Roseobacter sp. EG26]|uniref:hypothetical protein n=1 Tax=Roseobacter sp. EG26 TaxID=3412477 RepID=UPI003CE44FDF